MGYVIMHLPGCELVLGDEVGIEKAKKDTGREYIDEKGRRVPALTGMHHKPLKTLEG